MKKHTGESPEIIIDQSFVDIVMAPMGLLGASIIAHFEPNTRR